MFTLPAIPFPPMTQTKKPSALTAVTIFKPYVWMKETTTGIKGQLLHALVCRDNIITYMFQPVGLHPKWKVPNDPYAIFTTRIPKDMETETVELPMELLGQEVEDSITGFKGIASAFIIHPDRCVHVSVVPKGVNPETNNKWQEDEFDIRRLKGRAMDKLLKDLNAENKKLLKDSERNEAKAELKSAPSPSTFSIDSISA